MADSGWKQRHGVWFPASMHDVMCDLTIGKKWREFLARGDKIDCEPWIPFLSAMKEAYGSAFEVSDWTRDHVRHWVMSEWPIYWGAASTGKAVLLDEHLVFPDHIGTFREVKVGDEVICATGRPAKVVAVHDQTDLDLFRVTFADGSSTVCARGHLWTVKMRGRIRWERVARRHEKAVCGFVTRTMPVERMAGWTEASLARHRPKVPLTKPVSFRSSEVPLDPYLLGCLLGDGGLSGGNVLFTSADDDVEVREGVEAGLTGTGCRLKRVGSSKFAYVISSDARHAGCNTVMNALRDLGVFGKRSWEKRVPQKYLINSIEVRRGVLSGLLDTDGTVDKAGRISFCSASEGLVDDVAFLLESLGAFVTRRRKQPFFTDHGVRKPGRTAYMLTAYGMSVETMAGLFRLTRKRKLLRVHDRNAPGFKAIRSVKKIEDRAAYPRETRCITLAETDDLGQPTNGLFPISHFTVTHNSHDSGACLLADYMVDPDNTVTLVGSTTVPMLQKRIWEAILKCLGAFQTWAEERGYVLPVRVANAGYSILTARDADNAASLAVKAGIHGVALDQGGKLQGAHMPYVRVVVDELATIRDMDAIVEAISNLQIAKDFKFAAMANPGAWTDPSSSIFCTPVGGVDSVTEETREWDSTFGAHILHDDGLQSPCVLHPELESKYPFLTAKRHLDKALQIARGNEKSPHYWKMVRGFPVPAASDVAPILDPSVAARQKVSEPAVFDYGRWRGTVAGIDPAWTTNGDGACRARCYLMVDENGRNYLDFTGGLDYLKIDAAKTRFKPASEQLAEQTVALMRRPFEADFDHTAVDSSGNQGLGSTLITMYGAVGIMEVNNSEKASEAPMFKYDRRPACDVVADRGTEAWIVLARFCEAGMVRGLPEAAKRALCVRHLAVDKDKNTGDVYRRKGKDRLEEKKEFKKRFDGKSPDEADACALAALEIKEKYGVVPFGFLDAPVVAKTSQYDVPQQKAPRRIVISSKGGTASAVSTAPDGYGPPAGGEPA